MFEPSKLDETAISRCLNTVSSNAFYLLVGSALLKHEELSVVRMADGERFLFNWCNGAALPLSMGDDWMKRYGVAGMPKLELLSRLIDAATACTYFAPSVSGIHRRDYNVYDLFPARERYVDNFFSYAWPEDYKIQLLKTAEHVLFIHGDAKMANDFWKRADRIGVKVSWISMSSWEQAEKVAEEGKRIAAPLVLFSAGPASKWIGPGIAKATKSVALDVGSAASRWTLPSLAATA